ncbi:Uncharacterised protein [Escherichia coli]|uniref:hypothetical protein n=1 Tax=Escherichia coli TaxID=562 RepID=UPI001917E4BD|nr:hypothetical protein [Escherichia coli]CAD5644759.1 Uncharacterised protein [Escherichia coli]CAD5646075.1 Uncharacterised protein [Escherichia coli]
MKEYIKLILTSCFLLSCMSGVNISFATTQVVWGGNSNLAITKATYVNGYINVYGNISLPVNYNMDSWCASGGVNSPFKPDYATGWASISKGYSISSWLEGVDGKRIKVYVDSCLSGECYSDYNDFLWLGGRVSGNGNWATELCKNSNSGGGAVGVSRSISFGMKLRTSEKLVGGQNYTLELNMNGGEIKSDSLSELNSILSNGHFVHDVWHSGGMRYNTTTARVNVPVEVTCSVTASNNVDWKRLEYTKSYFEQYKLTGVKVSCNGNASVTITQRTSDELSVGLGLISQLSSTTSKPGRWPIKTTVGAGITTIPLYAYLYGTMNDTGIFSGTHVLGVTFD